MKTYVGKRMAAGPCQASVVEKHANGSESSRELHHVCRHSPDGFQWGYGGSGPADLALSVLADLIGLKRAERLYQDFKWKFIAPVRGDLELREDEILAWVEAAEKAGRAETRE